MTTHLESSSERAGGTLDRDLLTLVTVILAIWLAAAVVLAAAGAFAGSPTQPPLGILLAVVLPPLLFATLYRVSGRVQDFALAIDLRWLTAIQAWRVIGVMFLAFYAFGLLPGLFAWPAGLGDAAVGLAAPFVLMAMLRDAPLAAPLISGSTSPASSTSPTPLAQACDQQLRHRILADGLRTNVGELPLSLVPSRCRYGSSSTSFRCCSCDGWRADVWRRQERSTSPDPTSPPLRLAPSLPSRSCGGSSELHVHRPRGSSR
jgi:hypothetical protein